LISAFVSFFLVFSLKIQTSFAQTLIDTPSGPPTVQKNNPAEKENPTAVPTPPKKTGADSKLSQGTDPSNRREYTEDELMEKFFKKKAPLRSKGPTKTYLPVFYEGMSRPLLDLEARGDSSLSRFQNLEIDLRPLIKVLDVLVDPRWTSRLDSIREKCGIANPKEKKQISIKAEFPPCWGGLSSLSDNDVKFIFNEKELEIRLFVAPSRRAVRITSVILAPQNIDDIKTESPSWFSTYLNFNFNQSFQSNNTALQGGREPLLGKYDSATRFGDLVIEAAGRSSEKRPEIPNGEPAFIRENVRGIYDFESLGWRSQLGDLSYPVRSFQKFQPMGGFALFSQSSLEPSKLTNPSNSYELDLIRPSKITLYINDKILQQIDLPAGRHDLRDFPFAQGSNDLRIEIVDDVGRKETKTYNVLINNELLLPGENNIAYAFGLPTTENLGERTYDSANFTSSVLHRYGFSQGLTLGGSYQADSIQTNANLEYLAGAKFGYYSIESAYSKSKFANTGYAAKAKLVFQDFSPQKKGSGTTSLELSTESNDYTFFGTPTPINPVSLRFQGQHSRPISKEVSLNGTANYNFNRKTSEEIEDSYSYSIGVSRQWTSELSTNFNFRHFHSPIGKDEVTILVFLVWSQPKEKQFVTVSGESTSGTTRADWTYQPSTGVGGSKTRLNLQNRKLSSLYGGDYEYTANRARLNLNHQVEVLKDGTQIAGSTDQSKAIHSTSLQLGSAISYAGGSFALSRPIFDGFVHFSPMKNLKNNIVQVNPQRDGTSSSETDWMGTAVATEVPSYAITNLTLKEKTKTLGVALPRDNFTVRPGYRAGYSIAIGTDATVYLLTKLLNQDGSPISMVAAYAHLMDGNERDSTFPAVTLFTNRSGEIRSEGFKPGRYQLEIVDSDYELIEFVIPETTTEEYQLQPLTLRASK
jgi:outer membrane usher protein